MLMCRSIAIAVLVTGVWRGESGGQRVGAIGEIVAVGRLQDCPNTNGSRTSARVADTISPRSLWLIRADHPTLVKPGERVSVLAGDEYRLDRWTDSRLRIKSDSFGNGAITLAPDVICSPATVDTTLSPFAEPDSGSYRVTTTADGVLRFSIRSGGALIKWNSGKKKRLQVVAAGHVAYVPGTELLVWADSTGRRAVIYVREGLVRLEGEGVDVGRGKMFELVERQRPREVVTMRNEIVRMTELRIAEHKDLFSDLPDEPPPRSYGRFYWRHPLTVFTAGMVTAGVIGCSRSDTRCGLRRRKSHATTIALSIPL
jgi:hypothetical protein